jgi:molybdenum storage protein
VPEIRKGEDQRLHIESRFARESLVDRDLIGSTHTDHELPILPDAHMVGIGGASVMDRGREVVVPLCEEIAELRGKEKFIIGVGGGARVRHTYRIGMDLGIPIGGLAQLVGAMEECNAILLQAMLAKHGSILMAREHFWELPLYLHSDMIPIVISIPPYHFWEPPPAEGELPEHGSDFGLLIMAEVLGLRSLVLVKDTDGICTADPKKDPKAQRIPHLRVGDLLARPRNPDNSYGVDHEMLVAFSRGRNLKRVQIVSAFRRGALTRALAGQDEGTILSRD